MKHIIIESEDALHHVRTRFPNDEITWHTTSPWLLEKLPSINEKVVSLEEGVEYETQQKLCEISLKFSDQFASFINQTCHADYDEHLPGRALERAIHHMMYLLLYKSFLLNRWYEAYAEKHNQLKIVGDLSELKVTGFMFAVGLHDTIYAKLCDQANLPEVEIIQFSSDPRPMLPYPQDKKILRFEKPLTLFSNSLSALIFFVWQGLRRREILKKRSVSLFRKEKSVIFFFKNCESLAELFLRVLFRKSRVVDCNEIFSVNRSEMNPLSFEVSSLLNGSQEILKTLFKDAGMEFNVLYFTASQFVSRAAYKALAFGKDLLRQFEDLYQTFLSYGDIPKAILTNHMTLSQQRFLQQYLVRKNIPFFSFQHSITEGLDGSQLRLSSKNYNSYGEDYWCCHSSEAVKYHNENKTIKGAAVVGAPESARKVPFHHLMRFSVRKNLGLCKSDRMIMYIATIPRNNVLFVPNQNDLEYYRATKHMVFDVLSKTDDRCFVKLYPLVDPIYSDSKSFLENMSLPKNVSLIRYVSFKQIRVAPDVIIINYAGNGLSDAWSTGLPLIYVEFPSLPLASESRERMKQSVFYIDGSSDTWISALNELLALPHKTLLTLWKEKQETRKIFEEEFMFGPRNMAKNASQYILDTITN